MILCKSENDDFGKVSFNYKGFITLKRYKREDLFQDDGNVLVSNAIEMDEVKLKYSFKSIIREQRCHYLAKKTATQYQYQNQLQIYLQHNTKSNNTI